MTRREAGLWSGELRGPGLFLADHAAFRRSSLLAAGIALALFARRAVSSHGWRRWLWIALAAGQFVQLIGIARLRFGARAPST
jgi:hypothetical protein